MRDLPNVLAADRERIERDERGGRLVGELRNAGGGRMEAQLQRVEVESARGDDHDLAVDDAARRKAGEQRGM